MSIITMPMESIMCGKVVVAVEVLSVPAVYVGSDQFFDYWRGVDGVLYGV